MFFRRTSRFLVTTALAGVLALGPAFGASLTDALITAYQTSPLLESSRASLRSLDENVAQVRSQKRPQVDASISADTQTNVIEALDERVDSLQAALNASLLIFDNGLKQGWSRVIELDPVNERIVSELGTPNRSEFFSRVMGAAQGLPNGNVLITTSAGGQGLELTAAGLPAWIFMGTHRTDDGYRVKIPRMTRISTAETDALLDRMQRP